MEQYHDAPHTLDPNREIPDDAPPSAGHNEEMAEEVKARDEGFTEGVQEEQARIAEEGEVGPQEPVDTEGRTRAEREDEEGDPSASDGSSDDVPDGTVEEVLNWVGDDHERAQRALQAERDGKNRSSLISELEQR